VYCNHHKIRAFALLHFKDILFVTSCVSTSCLPPPRNPRDYFAIFDKAEVVSADGQSSEHFELICCKCVDTYVTVKKNQNQICWKFQKVGVGVGSFKRENNDAEQQSSCSWYFHQQIH